MNIDHINISAPKELLEKVKSFYCDVLGMNAGFRPRFSSKGYWLYAGDKALIHLVESDAHFENEKAGYLDHFALRTTRHMEILERLDLHKISYRTTSIPDIGLTQIFCKDPSGTGVEISFLNEKG